MREIKFRAWDKAAERMYLVGGIVWDGGGIVEVDQDDGPEITHPIVMQYTGLKDKNGKEIYEGDLLQFEGPKGIARSSVDFINGCFYAFNLTFAQWHDPKWEVIGNIYENPELLNQHNNADSAS